MMSVDPSSPPVADAATPLLRIEGVVKRFGGVTAVDDLSLDIGRGEFFALLGPSGCGKTTLLRMLAGFEMPDAGRIMLDGVDIASVLPHRRPINMMFQSYALFPHLTVGDNIAFGLRRAGLPRPEIDTRVAEMVALVRLDGLQRRRPDQLSGGQRQRVALARALARRPRLLLLDEPLAALDKKLREETQAELIELQHRLGTSFVIVTHDQDEAMTMADRIGVMNAGRLAQVATPRTLYEAPASRWIAGFVGDVNLIDGRVTVVDGVRLTIATDAGETLTTAAPREGIGMAPICLAIRPEKIRLALPGKELSIDRDPASNRLDGKIADIAYLGGMSHYRIKLDGGGLLRVARANTARHGDEAWQPGARVSAFVSPDDCVVLTS